MFANINTTIDPNDSTDLVTIGLCPPSMVSDRPFGVAGIIQATPETMGEIRQMVETANECFNERHAGTYQTFSFRELAPELQTKLLAEETDERMQQIALWMAKHGQKNWCQRVFEQR